MPAEWMLDELAFAGAEHLDEAFVAKFDAKQGRPVDQRAVAAFEAHGLGPGSIVVDLAAGTGQFSLPAAHFGNVVAVDVSEVMLARLRKKATEAGCENIYCVQAGFLTYEHDGPLADGVHTRHALHQVPDFWKAGPNWRG